MRSLTFLSPMNQDWEQTESVFNLTTSSIFLLFKFILNIILKFCC